MVTFVWRPCLVCWSIHMPAALAVLIKDAQIDHYASKYICVWLIHKWLLKICTTHVCMLLNFSVKYLCKYIFHIKHAKIVHFCTHMHIKSHMDFSVVMWNDIMRRKWDVLIRDESDYIIISCMYQITILQIDSCNRSSSSRRSSRGGNIRRRIHRDEGPPPTRMQDVLVGGDGAGGVTFFRNKRGNYDFFFLGKT